MLSLRRTWSRRSTGEKGSVLLVTVLSMPVLIGFTGLALDVGTLYVQRRAMQTAADAGALAGAAEIYRGQTTLVSSSALSATAANRYANTVDGVSVTVNRPPATGYYVGNPQYVEVLITQPAQTYFMRVFGFNSVTVPARAVAGVGARSDECLYALDPTLQKSLKIQGSSSLSANCGLVVDSSDPSALYVESSTTVNATQISVTGGASVQGSTVTPAPTTQAPPEPDPLASLAPPVYGGCSYNNTKITSGTVVLNPGVYCGGIEVTGTAHAVLNPGMYVLEGGLLVDGGDISGSEVTIYNANSSYKPIKIQSTSTANLSAPTSGPYDGILFFQDRSVPIGADADVFQSTGTLNLKGVLYFPKSDLHVGWSSVTTTVTGGVIANTIAVASSSSLVVNKWPSSAPGQYPLKRLSLVE